MVTRVLVRESRRMGVNSWRGGDGGKRLEWCKEGAISQGVPCGYKGKESDLSQKEFSAADTLIFDIWPLHENTFVWFQATR